MGFKEIGFLEVGDLVIDVMHSVVEALEEPNSGALEQG